MNGDERRGGGHIAASETARGLHNRPIFAERPVLRFEPAKIRRTGKCSAERETLRGTLFEFDNLDPKTVPIETNVSEFGGTFFPQPNRPCFFSEPRREKQKQKFVTRNPGDTMGVSGHGSFFCLWAVRARSARASALTEPWASPPTAGAMKIERGGGVLMLA